jgi:hypothetical protein
MAPAGLLCGSWVAIRPPDGSTRRAASSPRHPESRVPARRKVRRRRPDGLLPDQGEPATGLMKARLRDGLRLAVCSPSRVGEGSQQLGFPPMGKSGLAWPVKALGALPGEQVDEHVLPPAVTQTRCDHCGSRPCWTSLPSPARSATSPTTPDPCTRLRPAPEASRRWQRRQFPGARPPRVKAQPSGPRAGTGRLRRRCPSFQPARHRAARRPSPGHRPPASACPGCQGRASLRMGRALHEPPSTRSVRCGPWSADQARPGNQQPVTDRVGGCLLAGDLGFAILLDVDLVAVGRWQHRCHLVGTWRGV